MGLSRRHARCGTQEVRTGQAHSGGHPTPPSPLATGAGAHGETVAVLTLDGAEHDDPRAHQTFVATVGQAATVTPVHGSEAPLYPHIVSWKTQQNDRQEYNTRVDHTSLVVHIGTVITTNVNVCE